MRDFRGRMVPTRFFPISSSGVNPKKAAPELLMNRIVPAGINAEHDAVCAVQEVLVPDLALPEQVPDPHIVRDILADDDLAFARIGRVDRAGDEVTTDERTVFPLQQSFDDSPPSFG